MRAITDEKLTGTKLGDYRLEQFIEQSIWGSVFLAHTEDATQTYLLCILSKPSTLTVKDREAYIEHFQYQASQISPLQHPYILPLLDYGYERGMVYLVSPRISMRSLRTRLEKSGPLDVLTIGRYLDQIAAPLEYAHQYGILHGNLSLDNIFIRLDGQAVVANFGMGKLLALTPHEIKRNLSPEKGGIYAPEQLLGKPIKSSTDVYALAAILYQLLTGFPVFTGSTAEEIAQQHLYTPVPPLNQLRSDLPAGLYSVIARAMAKDPAQRFSSPGMLANAYHRIVLPSNGTRVPFVVSSPPATQHPSLVVVSSQAEAPSATWAGSSNGDLHKLAVSTSSEGLEDHKYQIEKRITSLTLRSYPRASLMRRFRYKNVRSIALIALLLILLIGASGIIGILSLAKQGAATPSTTGQVMFFDNPSELPGHSDSLSVVIHGLNVPPSGYYYAAWLINDAKEEVVPLGTLSGANGTYTLNYKASDTNLLSAGQMIKITLEQGIDRLPIGKVMLIGTFPPKSSAHIGHLLVSFPGTPGQIGVLVGVLQQTRMLNIQADVLQSVEASHDTMAIRCVARNLIDVIEGKQGSHYQPLASTCAQHDIIAVSDGFGLLGQGYLTDSGEHATLAISQPDATDMMRLHAQLLITALTDVKGWVTTIEQDGLHLLNNPSDVTAVQDVVRLADAAYHGVDTNGDGQIDPGEGGALTAYRQGQLMTTLFLTANT